MSEKLRARVILATQEDMDASVNPKAKELLKRGYKPIKLTEADNSSLPAGTYYGLVYEVRT